MLPIWDMLVNGMVAADAYIPTLIVFVSIMILNLIISMLSCPVAARIATRVFIQTIRYKKILQITNKWDDDFTIYQGYYRHYMILLGLVCSLIIFLTFHSIASINGIYLLINYYSFKDIIYSSPVTESIFNIPNTRLYRDNGTELPYKLMPTPVSQYGLYTIQAFRAASQDALLTLGALMSYQIIVYLKEQHFPIRRISILLLIRLLFVLIINYNIPLGIINALMKNCDEEIISYVNVFFAPFPFALKFWETFENIIRCLVGFYFMRETLRVVQLRKDKLVDDVRYIEQVGLRYHLRFERTIQMFKIYAIMYFVLTCIILINSLFESHILFLFSSFNKNFNGSKFIILEVCIGIIIGILGILPSILYVAFLVALLNYIGRREVRPLSQIKSAKRQKGKEDRAMLMENFFSKRAKLEFSSTIITGVTLGLISAILVGYLLIVNWYVEISMQPGDYLKITDTATKFQSLRNRCYNMEYSESFNPKSILDHEYKQSGRLSHIGSGRNNCSKNIVFYKEPDAHSEHVYTQNIRMRSDLDHKIYLWLPNNSRIFNFKNVNQFKYKNIPMKYACYPKCVYISDPTIGAILCDKQKCNMPTSHILKVNSTKEAYNLDQGVYILFGENEDIDRDISFSINRTIVRGNDTPISLKRSKTKSMNNYNLILYEPRDINVGNTTLCHFFAVCHYAPCARYLLGTATFLFWCLIFFAGVVVVRRREI